MKKIPKQFPLFGQMIKVKIVENIIMDSNAVGVFYMHKNEIHIQDNCKGTPRTHDQMLQTFFHELTHAVLAHLSYEELNMNEQFVDQFGHCLHQSFKNAQF